MLDRLTNDLTEYLLDCLLAWVRRVSPADSGAARDSGATKSAEKRMSKRMVKKDTAQG